MTIFHVIKYPLTLPVSLGGLPQEVVSKWVTRVIAHRDAILGDGDHFSTLTNLYPIDKLSEPSVIVKACMRALIDAKVMIDWANLNIGFEEVDKQKQEYMYTIANQFTEWLTEELLNYEGPL